MEFCNYILKENYCVFFSIFLLLYLYFILLCRRANLFPISIFILSNYHRMSSNFGALIFIIVSVVFLSVQDKYLVTTFTIICCEKK